MREEARKKTGTVIIKKCIYVATQKDLPWRGRKNQNRGGIIIFRRNKEKKKCP